MKPFLSQWRAELTLAMRQGEQLLVSVGIPLGILVFFSQIDVVSFDGVKAVDYLTPATMALAVMSTSMVSLGIGTGFDHGNVPLYNVVLSKVKGENKTLVDASTDFVANELLSFLKDSDFDKLMRNVNGFKPE